MASLAFPMHRASSALAAVVVGLTFAMPARAAVGDGTPAGDSVIGTGYVYTQLFDINATSGPNGEHAAGYVNVDLNIGPFQGVVTGLCASGYQAVVYGIATVLPPYTTASGFILHVDDRSAQLLGPDFMRLEFTEAVPTSCPPYSMLSPARVTSGDVAVVDVLAPPPTFASVRAATIEYVLDSGQPGADGFATALAASLDAAERAALDGVTTAKAGGLQAFMNKVESGVKAGFLTAGQGQELTDQAATL